MNNESEDRKRRLQERFAAREIQQKRETYQAKVSRGISRALGRIVSSSDFILAPDIVASERKQESASERCVELPRISQEYASKILASVQAIASYYLIDLDEYYYVGKLRISQEELPLTPGICVSLNDSVRCDIHSPKGFIIVDYYNDPLLPVDRHFSLEFYGDELLRRVSSRLPAQPAPSGRTINRGDGENEADLPKAR